MGAGAGALASTLFRGGLEERRTHSEPRSFVRSSARPYNQKSYTVAPLSSRPANSNQSGRSISPLPDLACVQSSAPHNNQEKAGARIVTIHSVSHRLLQAAAWVVVVVVAGVVAVVSSSCRSDSGTSSPHGNALPSGSPAMAYQSGQENKENGVARRGAARLGVDTGSGQQQQQLQRNTHGRHRCVRTCVWPSVYRW